MIKTIYCIQLFNFYYFIPLYTRHFGSSEKTINIHSFMTENVEGAFGECYLHQTLEPTELVDLRRALKESES